jgi:hypothetical protein
MSQDFFSKLDKVAVEKNTNTFAAIEEDGYYTGHLVAMTLHQQDSKWQKEGEEPKTLVRFIFKVDKNDSDHNEVFVETKAKTFSFYDTSDVPKLWKLKGKTFKDRKNEFWGLVQDAEGNLKPLHVKCNVKLEEKNSGAFAFVDSVTVLADEDMKQAAMPDFYLKHYTDTLLDYAIVPGITLKGKNNK